MWHNPEVTVSTAIHKNTILNNKNYVELTILINDISFYTIYFLCSILIVLSC